MSHTCYNNPHTSMKPKPQPAKPELVNPTTTTITSAGPVLETPPPAHDAVNHPTHYTQHPSGVECIEITQHFNFCLGNAIKYIWRAGSKGDAVEDLKKAAWYVQCELDRIGTIEANFAMDLLARASLEEDKAREARFERLCGAPTPTYAPGSTEHVEHNAAVETLVKTLQDSLTKSCNTNIALAQKLLEQTELVESLQRATNASPDILEAFRAEYDRIATLLKQDELPHNTKYDY